MDSIQTYVGLGGVPFIVGLTWIFKPFVPDTRYYPFISLAWGLAINIGAAYALGTAVGVGLIQAIFLGILAGLSASGAYSAGSTLNEGALAVKTNRKNLPPSPPG